MAEQEENETTGLQRVETKRRPNESSAFESIFTQYGDSMAAVREFFSRLAPFVVEMEAGIVKEEEASIREAIKDFMRTAKEEEVQELKNFLEMLTGKTSPDTKPPRFEIKSLLVQEYLQKILKLVFRPRPKDIHRELLNKGILMCLVSYFEVLVADLAHAFFRTAPDAAFTEDKQVSVKELSKFSSIDEALRSITSEAVDDLLRGSVSDWHKFFQTRMKINMKQLAPDSAQWEEYFQRRHIMVHAGGRVTERYLSNVDWEDLKLNITQPTLGDKLDIDDAYLQHAMNAFEVTGLLLCQEVWKKLVPGDSEKRHSALTGLVDAVYRRLLSHHWYVAELLATWGERDTEAAEDSMLTCKFNRWLCIKRQGRWTEGEEEVKAFDCSAKNRKYAIARASLLEKADEFFELLPKALGAGDITIDALKEWPILDEMRADTRYAKVIVGHKKRTRRKKSDQ